MSAEPSSFHISRRTLIKGAARSKASLAASGWLLRRNLLASDAEAQAFIHRVPSYDGDLRTPILAGLRELGVADGEIRGKKILLKPNLVEPHAGVQPYQYPSRCLIRAAVEAAS